MSEAPRPRRLLSLPRSWCLLALVCGVLGERPGLARTVPTAPDSVEEAPATTLVRPRVELEVGLEPETRTLAGRMRFQVADDASTREQGLSFWLYPNHLATRSPRLVDFNYHWLYPGAFSPGEMTVQEVTASDGTPIPFTTRDTPEGAKTLLHVSLPPSPSAKGTLSLEITFTVRIPRRLGSFGCEDGQCRLLGGFYPMPVATGPGSTPSPQRLDGQITLHAPPGSLIVDGQPMDATPATLVFHDVGVVSLWWDQRAQMATDRAPAPAPPADTGANRAPPPRPDEQANPAPPQRPDEQATPAPGLGVAFYHRDRRAPPSHGALPYLREDHPGDVLAVAKNAIAFYEKLGLPLDTSRELVIVQAPLRQELVQVHGDLVMVSDRWFEIFPLERLRKFHVAELARGVFTALAARRLAASEPDEDVERAAALTGAALLDLFTVHAYRKVEHAQDLLRPVDFLPVVDQLLYAPLVASSSTYFGDIDERDPIRDDAQRLGDPAPSGRFLYAKLIDLLGPERTGAALVAMLRDRVPLRVAAERAFGGSLGWFWQQWLGPLPRVNYRLTRVRSYQEGGQPWVELTVRREGAAVREPVEVRVRERDKSEHDLVWTEAEAATAAEKTFRLAVPSGLARVELDPRSRLVETATGSLAAYDDPRADDRVPPGWRFLYSGAGGLLDLTQQSLSFVAAVQAKPLHDLRNELLLTLRHTPSVRAGASLAYYRLMGTQADRNRLTTAVGGGLGAAWLDPSYGLAPGEMPRGGWRLSSTLGLTHDDRGYLIDPWHANGLAATLGASLTNFSTGEHLAQVSFGIEAIKLHELAPGHVLAGLVGVGATFGDIRFRSQLGTVGGNAGLRGYFPDELFSRGQALVRAEIRNTYVANLDWNIAHFTAVRSLAGSFFVDAAAISSCEDFSVDKRDVYADVGYSFRVLHDAFGVYQQLLELDVAVPLDRRNRQCLGRFTQGTPEAPLSRIPFTVLIQFLPSF